MPFSQRAMKIEAERDIFAWMRVKRKVILHSGSNLANYVQMAMLTSRHAKKR
jgi:hypothetical protein